VPIGDRPTPVDDESPPVRETRTTTEPATTEPATTEPATTEPATTEPAAAAPDTAAPDTAAPDDGELVRALRAGDETVFVELVRRLSPDLLRVARVYVPSASVAEEVVQETWLVVIKGLNRFEGRSSLRGWIVGITVKIARRTGTRERRALPFSAAWAAERAPAEDPARFHPADDPTGRGGVWVSFPHRWDTLPEARLHAAEVRMLINKVIASLPRRQREVITARDVVGLDAAETGTLFGLTDGNQRVLLHRARSRVRVALERYFADADGMETASGQTGTGAGTGGQS
jgi:RNA polymerase sigma-70 factor (ECF subfamily)